MPVFDDRSLIEFLRRSYFVTDGLWFVKVEEAHGYDDAIRLDEHVWEVVPKIQARKAVEILKLKGDSLAEMALCLELKFASEGHAYRVAENSADRVVVEITECPWLEALRKSGRGGLALDVCNRICLREAVVWAAEFDTELSVEFEERLSDGGSMCRLVFSRP